MEQISLTHYSLIINLHKTHPSLEVLSTQCLQTNKNTDIYKGANTFSTNINSRNPHFKLQNLRYLKIWKLRSLSNLGVLTMCISLKPFFILDMRREGIPGPGDASGGFRCSGLKMVGRLGPPALFREPFHPPPPHLALRALARFSLRQF